MINKLSFNIEGNKLWSHFLYFYLNTKYSWRLRQNDDETICFTLENFLTQGRN